MHIGRMEHLLADEVAAVDGVLTDTRTVDFHRLGVAGAINRLTLPLRERRIAVGLETPHHGLAVNPSAAELLYRVAQELLSNIHKFARPENVVVRLAAVSHGVQLQVRDDGVGFDVKGATTGRTRGMGLRIMSSAVDFAGGHSVIDSHPGGGTCVTVTLPLD